MPDHAATAACAGGGGFLSDSQWRARRIKRQRRALWPLLEELLVEIPDVICYDFKDLNHLAGYRVLEHEGLVHACVVRATGCFTIIAATRRVLGHPTLRSRLFALRRLARDEFRRTLVVGPRSLKNEAARLRAKRKAGLSVVPAPCNGR